MSVQPPDFAGPHLDRAALLLAALPSPVLLLGPQTEILFANAAAEQVFAMGEGMLLRQSLRDIVAEESPLLSLLARARLRGAAISEHDVAFVLPRNRACLADVSVTPLAEPKDHAILVLHERSIAQRFDRQFAQRGAARSLNGVAAVLAHEIKNPLAGIRGAAQLLEENASGNERELTRLICAETDRIRELIDRMESYGVARPLRPAPLNIHEILDHVRRVAQAGFARHLRITEAFDPSLPEISGDRDQLIEVFLNLVRNASEAVAETGGEIALSTAYRSGVHMTAGATRSSLPLEVAVRDNGAGVPPELVARIFDPFVTTKPRGSGLGLALVSRIVADHGGIVDCESRPGRTIFRVLLPMAERR
jgi:two-component system nitrogen regulation sensor histidine kinase GlnL